MEVRIPQPKELEVPGGAAVAASPTDTPSQPPPPSAPRDDAEDAPVPLYSAEETDEESSDEGEEFEFEFPFVSRDTPAGTAAPADELFADGRIRPFYPVFGRAAAAGGGGGWEGGNLHLDSSHDGTARSAPAVAPPRVRGQLGRLFLEETRERNASTSSTASSSSSAATDDGRDGLEGAVPESYCVWRPGSSASSSPRPPRKSGSTGSMARWRRISDLVVGRSHSDGKEKFLFFATPPPPNETGTNKDKPKPKPTPAGGRKPSPTTATTEIDTVAAAHRIAYLAKCGGTGGGGGVLPGGTPRRTFLPYRQELVGFFANVNGISRSHQHPF